MKHSHLYLAIFMALSGNAVSQTTRFVQVDNGIFTCDESPYYYIGTNFWYGAILASEGIGGDRERLHAELDSMQNIGINNLRILVGADGDESIVSKVEPTLQKSPGVYNDTLLYGLDYLLAEMDKRAMKAVLYLNNSWEWSGGYSCYLQWSGFGQAPVPAVDGWPAFNGYVEQFVRSEKAKALFADHVAYIIGRTNQVTGRKYVEDPAIMSWQIGNEPRAFHTENKELFADWMSAVAAQIRSLDPNHLISSGSEGKHGCELDIALYEKIHADPNIDYLNIHIWPYNWGWAPKDSLQEKVGYATGRARAYIDEHLAIGRSYGKPVVLEEFGFPRDGFCFALGTPTESRDAFYASVFEYIVENKNNSGNFVGCNFWGWGGLAVPSDESVYWKKGAPYTGDPAQEEQGLNSVFLADTSTIDLIRKYTALLQ